MNRTIISISWKGNRGLSPVIAISLLVVITLLLAVVLFLLSSDFTAPEPATRASVQVGTVYSYGRGPTGDGTGRWHGHPDPDFVKSDESYMFFYEFDGEVPLIFLHDSPASHTGHDPTNAVSDGTKYSDTGGGAVDLELDGEPSEADWVGQDDAKTSKRPGPAPTAVIRPRMPAGTGRR